MAARLEARFEARMQRQRFDPRRPLLVGFSHGADSTALLWLSRRWQRRVDDMPEVVAVTIDHGLRATSAADAEAARAYAESLGVRSVVVSPRLVRASETEARAARYQAFEALAQALDAQAVLLAHHRADQRETVLHRFLRGTGAAGLRGMPMRRRLTTTKSGPCFVLRPLLTEEAGTLRACVTAHGLPVVEDASNADPGHTLRNYLRHCVLCDVRLSDAVEALRREAQAFHQAVHRELADSAHVWEGHGDCSLSLQVRDRDTPAALSPWAREELFVRGLDRLGARRPTRQLLRRAAALLDADARVGKRIESTGHWSARRERQRVLLMNGLPQVRSEVLRSSSASVDLDS